MENSVKVTYPTLLYDAVHDVAMIPIHGTTLEATESLPIATESYSSQIDSLQPTLSMYFNEGLTDLFSSLGNVLSNFVGTCNDSWGCIYNEFDFTTSNDVGSGASGSPIINVRTGEVIGLTVASPSLVIKPNWTFATSSRWLEDLQ